jgi:serine/threonine protein kinase
VRHPAIVSIIDILFDSGDPWIVMEYISGRSLDAIIKSANRTGQPLDEQMIAAMGLPVLGALSAAHRAGVVHRDVKPANILVADDDSTGTGGAAPVGTGRAPADAGTRAVVQDGRSPAGRAGLRGRL